MNQSAHNYSEPGIVDPSSEAAVPGRPLAVIDIGTTSIRMAVAQLDENGVLHTLEKLQQPVSLGKDTFTTGVIEFDTIIECVTCLRNFSKVLREYGMSLDRRRVRAVATSAVREASNRETFLDHLYMSTGLEVDVIDEAEGNRFTYLCMQPFIREKEIFAGSQVLIVEVGGGSTELLGLQEGRVTLCQEFRLGSLRLRQLLEDYRAPAARLRELLDGQIARTIDQIQDNIGGAQFNKIVAIGGDARFAVSQLLPDWDQKNLARLPASELQEFTKEILTYSVDELVRKYHLTYPEAETLGPALLVYVRLAEASKVNTLYVAPVTMRDGLLAELAAHGAWTDEFAQQIVHSATSLAEKYRCDLAHAEYVADLSRQLYAKLQSEHQLPKRFELLLKTAALLHDIGSFVSTRSHHKHSRYLIMNSELFGLGARDMLLIALVSRYHRRALPKPTHEDYASLDRYDRITVCRLAAILRVADALDRSHTQRVRIFAIDIEQNQLLLQIGDIPDMILEKMAIEHKANLFEQVFGLKVVLQRRSTAHGRENTDLV